MKHLVLPLAVLLGTATAHAQSSPGYVDMATPRAGALGATQLNGAFASKQDVNGDASGQHVTLSSSAPTLQALLTGAAPIDYAVPAACTSGNVAGMLVRNTQQTLSGEWAALVQQAVPTCDGIASFRELSPGDTTIQNDALAGYLRNRNPVAGVTGVGVAVGGFATNEVDRAQSWLYDGIATDLTCAGCNGTGRLMQSELDYKPLYPKTQVVGFINAMDSTVQSSGVSWDGWVIGSTAGNPGFPGKVGIWDNGFRCYDGSASTCFRAGLGASTATGVPANTASMPLAFDFSTTAGTLKTWQLYAGPDGMHLSRADNATTLPFKIGGNVDLNGVLTVASSQVVGARNPGWTAGACTNQNRGAINYETATAQQLGERLCALENALFAGTGHGLIGP